MFKKFFTDIIFMQVTQKDFEDARMIQRFKISQFSTNDSSI